MNQFTNNKIHKRLDAKTFLGVQLPSREKTRPAFFHCNIENSLKIVNCKLKIVGLIALAFFLWNDTAEAATIGKPNNFLLQSGLVGWWTFDGADMARNVVDRSGTGNTGYLTNIISTSTTQALGKQGQAFRFPAPTGVSTSSITVKHNSSLSPTSAVSVSAWVKPNGIGTCGQCYLDIVRKGTWSIWIGFRQTGAVLFYLSGVNNWVTDDGSGDLFDGKWHHVVFNYDGSMQTFYIDGVKISETVASGSIATNSNDMTIGNQFNNLLDDVRVYNRALIASEIKALYKSGGAKVASTPTLGGSSSDGLSSGLVGHWSFDGPDMTPNVRDRSGSGKHGNLSGQTSTSTAIGKLGQAMSFDGSNDYVSLGNNAMGNLGDLVTVSVWVRPVQVDGDDSIISEYDAGVCGDFYMRHGVYDGLDISVHDGDSVTLVATSSAPINTWTHAVFVSNTNNAYIYINGILNATLGSDLDWANTCASTDVRIGNDGDSRFFSGRLDDLRIYNRALSETEIIALYKLGGSKVASTPGAGNTSLGGLNNGLVGYWTFDGADMRPNVRDRSGQGNHGNLIGQTSTTTAIGKLGQAMSFDGTNDLVNAGSASALDNLTSWTSCAWVYIRRASSPVDILTKTNVIDGAWYLYFDYNGANSNFQAYQDFDVAGAYASSQNGVIRFKQWAYICSRFDTSDSQDIRLYLNGSEVASYLESGNASGNKIDDSTRNIGIGGNVTNSSRYFDGLIDDVRLYNRALSASEIRQLYNLGR